MTNENNILTPAKIELISNVSGAYSSPFWDRLREVTGTLDTVRKMKAVLETLCSTGNELEVRYELHYNKRSSRKVGDIGQAGIAMRDESKALSKWGTLG